MRVSAAQFASIEQLRSIEEHLGDRPGDANLRYERARCLDDLGRVEDAMYAYREVLLADPRHFAALTNLGTLFVEQDRPEGAAVCFRAALDARPDDPLAHLNLAALHVAAGALADARAAYVDVLERFRDDDQARVHAHNGLARVLERTGEHALAAQHAAAALARPVVWTTPYRGTGAPLRVLVLTSPRGGDVISNQFFDDRIVERTTIVPESFRGGAPLPAHDLIFNGIGEPDATHATLACAAQLIARSSAPVINDPRAVLRTDREAMMARLAGVPELVAPRTQRFARADLTPARLAAAALAFPLLVRSPGFHAGTHFAYVGAADELAERIVALPGETLYAIAFHDAAGTDGWVRKYRVAFIDGHAYPIHLALARQWKVHYFSAAMADEPAHREEERAFLDDLPGAVGRDGMAALAAVNAALQLDYGGVDFGRGRDGRVIVFEANATMTINAPPDDPRWNYRRPAHERAIGAVRAMIRERARRHAGGCGTTA